MSEEPDAARERLARVRERIEAACQQAQRPASDVRLLAVSKLHPPAAIRALYTLGVRDFGENYAQELLAKAPALDDLPELRWHFIGNLQSNKAAALSACCAVVHSVASLRAGRALGRRAVELGRCIEVMVQVNVGRESQKAGIAPEAVGEQIAQLREVDGLALTGLMTIPPAGDPQRARACYEELAQLARDHGLRELSMGMSADLESAIACGATWVRIGTDLFGPRPG